MSNPIEAVPHLSDIGKHAEAMREVAAVEREVAAVERERNGILRDGLKTARELPGAVGSEARSTVAVVGQETRDTVITGSLGTGLLMVLWFLLKLVIWWFTKK